MVELTGTKVTTTIRIDSGALATVRELELNLSQEVTDMIVERYFDRHKSEKRLKKLKKEMAYIKKTLKEKHKKEKDLIKSLSMDEKLFLKNVQNLVSEGRKLPFIWKRFKAEFKKDMSYQVFLKLTEGDLI